jgi:hypothetical protein
VDWALNLLQRHVWIGGTAGTRSSQMRKFDAFLASDKSLANFRNRPCVLRCIYVTGRFGVTDIDAALHHGGAEACGAFGNASAPADARGLSLTGDCTKSCDQRGSRAEK